MALISFGDIPSADLEFYGLAGGEAGEGLASEIHGHVMVEARVHTHRLPSQRGGDFGKL